MNRAKVQITDKDTIRCSSPRADCMHEFDVKSGRVLYRQIAHDGSRLERDLSDWMFLTIRQISLHYHNGPPQLREWFQRRGVTKERIGKQLEAVLATKRTIRRRR